MVESKLLDRQEQALDLTGRDLSDWLDGIWDGRGARELCEDRRHRQDTWRREEIGDVISGEEGTPVPLSLLEPHSATRLWRGIAVSPGQVTAIARVIRSPEEGSEFGEGEILVAPNTHPGWTPLFLRASAVVMETGGYLSHGAIVAREYGLPAVVNLPGLLRQVRNGERLTVDGNAGTVLRGTAE
ncbi:MAG: PEP-utilizing enzyme [Acidobacteriota bacterium]